MEPPTSENCKTIISNVATNQKNYDRLNDAKTLGVGVVFFWFHFIQSLLFSVVLSTQKFVLTYRVFTFKEDFSDMVK